MHSIGLTWLHRSSPAAVLLREESGGEAVTIALAMGLVVATMAAVTGQFDAAILSFYRDAMSIGREIATRLPA